MIEPRRPDAAGRLLRIPDALARRARRPFVRLAARRGAGLILFYHRIAAPPSDPWRIAVSSASFDRQLRMLNDEFQVLPLAELVLAARRGRIPPRAVAISFDDGYFDNLDRALPLLEAHRVPATFYIATGYVDRHGPFWWDELQQLLSGPGERPERLDLTLGGTRIAAGTGTAAEREQALLETVHPVLRHSPAETGARWLELIREWAGPAAAAEVATADLGRPMSSEELARLAASELVELGAHTANHPSLLTLSADEQRSEVELSRDFLAERGGRPPASFSLPFGDNSARSRRIVRSCGFDHAVGVREELPLTAAADRFELPRLMPVEEPAAALGARIEAVLGLGAQPS